MYTNILVPFDGSSTSRLGLREALRLARASNATLRIVYVADDYLADTTLDSERYFSEWIQALREEGAAVLHEAVKFAKKAGCVAQSVFIDTLGVRVADAIIEQAKQWPADLIVMGTHGRRGLRRLVMGSDAEMVMRRTPVPILLVREPAGAS